MKTSLICPLRNKAKHCERQIKSMFAQTYSPMEIILSVQKSDDDTTAIVKKIAKGYDGPNKVRVVQCPDNEFKGQAGLVNHLNWLHGQIEGDYVCQVAGDDWTHPEFVAECMKAWQKGDWSWVASSMNIEQPDGSITATTQGHIGQSRVVSMAEAVSWQIGSSGPGAWMHDLWDRCGPLVGIESIDLIMPIMAVLERGMYYIDRVLYHQIAHADLNNTGMEGQLRAARNDREQKILTELNNWHNTSNWCAIMRRIQGAGMMERLDPAGMQAIMDRVVMSANIWALARDQLTMERLQPKAYKI